MRTFHTIKSICCILICLFLVACQGHSKQSPHKPHQNEQPNAAHMHMPMLHDKPTRNNEPMRGPLNP